MLAAQEMFRDANKVTKPEKALILGFMAGARGIILSRNTITCNRISLRWLSVFLSKMEDVRFFRLDFFKVRNSIYIERYCKKPPL